MVLDSKNYKDRKFNNLNTFYDTEILNSKNQIKHDKIIAQNRSSLSSLPLLVSSEDNNCE